MRVRTLALCLAVQALAATAVPAQDAPLAVLMARQGEVRVIRGGGAGVAGQFGMPLQNGDEIRTGADSAADILFAAGNSIHLGANSNLVVQGGHVPAAPGGGSGSFDSMQRFLKLKESRGTSSLATLRSGAVIPELTPVGPCQTKVREERPTFAWRESRQAGPLRLTVYRNTGIQWQGEIVEGERFTYPADAPALASGVRYSWTIETTDPLQFPPLRSAASFFEILAPGERAALDKELGAVESQDLSPSGHELMRAGVLFGHGLLDDAIAATSRALAADAQNPDLRSILARLYAETGRTTEAMAEYDRLLAPR